MNETAKPTTMSLTEWLENIQPQSAIAFREEDNDKRYRLEDIQKITGLSTDRLWRFTAAEVAERTPRLQDVLEEIGNRNCALRLVPLNPELPKLRIFRVPITEALAWFDAQKIDHTAYRVELMPRPSSHLWSTIFIVNAQGIFGEIIADSHDRLTQSIAGENKAIAFSFDWTQWRLSEENSLALRHVQELAEMIRVDNAEHVTALKEKLQATFSNGYLNGYFETVCTEEFGTWFIDYNRILGEMYHDASVTIHQQTALRGQTGCPGTTTGRARVIHSADIASANFPAGDILITDMTTPDCLPLMKRASGIASEYGGILSHAAITSREMKKPCVVGVKDLLSQIHDGDLVRLDATNGTIEKIA